MQTLELEKIETQKIVGGKVKSAAPTVSVIIPAYNISAYIAETLDSVLRQTFKDLEILIINDGSPDTEEFEKILEPFMDEIIYLKGENKGAGFARNIAIEHARGELVAFLDGDDVWLPEFLESQVNFLRKHNYDFVYADALLFGGSALNGKSFMKTAPSKGEANFDSLLSLKCNIITSGSVARKQTIVDAGMFETEKVRAHDYLLWLKMAKNGARIGYQKKVLLKYRVHLDSLSGNSVQRVERSINVYHRVLNKIELNDSQREIVKKQLARLEADLRVERGKSFLLQEDFDSAEKAFAEANKYRKSPRLQLIIWLVKLVPRYLLKFYKSRRKDEINFIPIPGKQTH
jgi:glycosyltransferase involved in cell wall biosynthesis